MSVKIFIMTHKQFEVPDNPMYIPLQVGRAVAENLGYMGDDTGDSISEKNCYYSELTGLYWIWKNYHEAEYVGCCHYRRFLISEKGHVFSEKEIESILQVYDVITTKQVVLNNSYYYGFGQNHNGSVLDETGRVIEELYPEYAEYFYRLVHENRTYFGNMLICRKDLYDAYAHWLFSILQKVEKRADLYAEDEYHRRVLGFISEFLLYVWIQKNQYTALECRVGMIGEKAETREVKDKLKEYLMNKDIQGAKEYFAQVFAKRPDILMEASDINGELKTCLQILSTAEYEREMYEDCVLEHGYSYERLLQTFHKLNQKVQDLHGRGLERTEDILKNQELAEWCEKQHISKEGIRIAATLYGK